MILIEFNHELGQSKAVRHWKRKTEDLIENGASRVNSAEDEEVE